MALSLRKGLCLSSPGPAGREKKTLSACMPTSPRELSPRQSELRGKQVALMSPQAGQDGWALGDHAIHAQATSVCIPRSMRWWEKGAAPNVIEIGSAQELVDSLLDAGDRLVVVDFYSPGCGGCKAVHPKICQFAETNPDVLFLKVNYEEHKSMCYSLNVHVLPFFRFYRGAQGRVCSFSCTNGTIKKFKDAMAKHGAEKCDAGPAKGLEESELLKLASNGDLQFNLPLVSSSRVNDSACKFGGSSNGGAAEGEEQVAALAL